VNEKMQSFGFPSKVYTIMACKKPMIVISGYTTPLYNFLKDKNCAEIVDFENKNEAFYNAVVRVYSDELYRKKMGENAYRSVLKNNTKEVILKKYILLLNSL